MDMLCGEIRVSAISLPHVSVLTYLRASSVQDGSLEISALVALHEKLQSSSRIVSLPRLHAKVYVADCKAAIVTSVNLTRGGLDLNYEYGVLLTERSIVTQIREDLESFAVVGSPLGVDDLYSLETAAQDLCREYQSAQRSISHGAREKFNQILQRTEIDFLGSLVGQRTKNTLFSETILYVLRHGPLSTEGIHRKIQGLLPELCDDSKELMIKGQRFGKAWKHAVRNAQQGLKRRGRIDFDSERWHRAGRVTEQV